MTKLKQSPKPTELEKVLMQRDGLTFEQAQEEIAEAKEILESYLEEGDHESAHDICSECFGLEPDYIFDVIHFQKAK